MAGVSLKCGDCGALLRSVEEAQEHAELTSHSNFAESTEAVLNLVCSSCGKPCRSKTESDLHTKRTGHTEFVDKTSEATKPISLEVPKVAATELEGEVDASTSQSEEMVVPEVDKKLLEELEAMGFPTARATRALHYSGNASLEAAINWVVEHENDSDIDQLPMVPANTKVEAPKPSLTPEQLKAKQQELREKARKKKEEEEKRMEREREKERIRVGKELLEAKRIEEENERKRSVTTFIYLSSQAERRRRLGLPPEDPSAAKPAAPVVEEKKTLLPIKPVTKVEQMRECLRSLKQNHKDDDAKVKKAFQTLLTYIGNVVRNPEEEKFRKIRLSNPSFQERVGALKGGIEFLELCGFEKIEGSEYLFLARDKVDVTVLHSAGAELDSAIKNPFFGVL
ncbi:Zinc finger, C2H2 domain containing protein [Parasponia andersonii]|uniref:Zinc finger, C2H2 domain containing protein n=1 Tax=Parasponia andersonii TaxID=3476 RepID=A0A2P5A883_PARAD|nr:Zinc finger, C2H2 domain containing protein [Parasponia andersonii]